MVPPCNLNSVHLSTQEAFSVIVLFFRRLGYIVSPERQTVSYLYLR